MAVTELERRRIIDEHTQKVARELSQRMRELGKKRTPAKRAAALKNVKKAQAARWGRPYIEVKPRKR
jgi:hypothetical protein